MSTQFDITTNESYVQIESQLSSAKFLSGNDYPNSLDAEIFIAVKSKPPSKDSFPTFYNWFLNISQFAESLLKLSLESQTSGKTEIKAQKEVGDDLFDSDEEPSAPQTHQVKMTQVKKTGGKSILIFEVKVFDSDQDLDELAKRIFEIEMEGLVWRTEYQIEPVIHDVKMLVVGCTIEDDLVYTDDIFDKIQAWDDEVQSIDIRAFQKV